MASSTGEKTQSEVCGTGWLTRSGTLARPFVLRLLPIVFRSPSARACGKPIGQQKPLLKTRPLVCLEK
jgi:hypothetical protein